MSIVELPKTRTDALMSDGTTPERRYIYIKRPLRCTLRVLY